MAILFDDASSEYLTVASTPITAVPLTISAWFNSDASTVQTLVDLHASGSGNDANDFKLTHASTRAVLAYTNAAFSISSTVSTLNTWNHACGVWASATSRTSYLNGGGKVTETTNATPAGVNQLNVGRQGGTANSLFVSGMVGEVAIYNVALTDAEVATLALGFSPLFIRPDALVYYLPMIALGSTTQNDWIGGRVMTETNTPATAAHPPNIIYPDWMTSGYGFPAISSALSGTLNMVGEMIAIPLSATYKIFSSDVPKRTFKVN